jgi:hypothetical protein
MNHQFLRGKHLCLFIFMNVFVFFNVLCDAKEDTARLVFKKSASSSTETYTYTVKKGEHLLDIVKYELGITQNRYTLIKRHNPHIKNLDLIHPGQKIFLPAKSAVISPSSMSNATVPPLDPNVKKGVLQSGVGLPSANRLALMQTILQRMNSKMMTSGRHVIPIPEIGQINVDCNMIPVIEFDDGSAVFIDFKSLMPENIKRLIRKHWPNYAVISANVQDDILKVLAGAINASRSYTMLMQANPFTFGLKPALRFPIDWLITGKPLSPRSAYMQALMAIKTEDQRLPEPIVTYLVKKQVVVTEILNSSALASWPAKVSDSIASPMPQLNAGSVKDMLIDLLVRLGIQPALDTDVQIFDSAKDGFNLSIKADIEAHNGSQRVIFTSKQLPKQFIDILHGKDTEIITLSENNPSKDIIEKTLAAFKIPYSTVPYMFPFSASTDPLGAKIIFPTIRFLTNKNEPFYLIDFNMEAPIYELLHDKMGFNIIKY